MNKTDLIKVFCAVLGTIFLSYMTIELISLIGTTSEPSTYDWWSVINFVMSMLVCHWSIEWIKDLFHD